MRKVMLSLVAVAALCVSGLANATGQHSQGIVIVGTDYMYGSMNNRYSTATTTSTTILYAYSYANSSVTFYGRDGSGNTFSCYVPTTSALYSQALDFKNNLTNGSFINVHKGTGSSECTSVYMLNGSHWLD